MTASDHLKRLLLDTIADNINEVIVGFDGTPATSSDGAAGRPALTLTPTVVYRPYRSNNNRLMRV